MTGGPAPLVDAGRLHADADAVVILDASIQRTQDEHGRGVFGPGLDAFAAERIPGARFADVLAAFSDPGGAFPFTLPTPARLQEAARAVGVDDRSTVVVYDRNGGAWAARVRWLLRTHGHRDVRVLDGGLGAWIAAGLPTASGDAAPVPRGDFTARDPGPVTAERDEVASISLGDTGGLLVCGLRRTEFEGTDEGPRSGHIPGSVSLPYPELLRDDGTLDRDRVRERARALGIDGGENVVLYCGGGINAAGLSLALEAVGIEGARIYDGSLSEWRADPAAPLQTGPGAG
ncbi:sulfurtransferase [Microbacterium sp. 18062]|uniref:sulfurtransferase n=1 Tax=Microbacterium sp. 18062 TaxID=2681410 RepID=UPI00135AFBCA|nr:sulfurtransferase [Microbacterium sp. 18062]